VTTLLLVHGAGNGPWVFADWLDEFPGVEVDAVDLQLGVDVGPFPEGVAARSESQRARAERKRGISITHLAARSLVVYGREFPDDRGRAVARVYGSREAYFPELDHWGLVRSADVRAAVRDFL
jgi:hypothetical protein